MVKNYLYSRQTDERLLLRYNSKKIDHVLKRKDRIINYPEKGMLPGHKGVRINYSERGFADASLHQGASVLYYGPLPAHHRHSRHIEF